MNKILFLIIALGAGVVQAEPSTLNSGQKSSIAYVPPMRGAPATRVGGGSRGMAGDAAKLTVLAPDHTGLTTLEQPVLYWYISKPMLAHLAVTVINEQDVAPLVDKDFGVPTGAGIQQVKLSDLGGKLKTGVEYRWYVSLILDENARSNDVIASGTILRTPISDDLKSKLAHASKGDIPSVYAENGIWYDALSTLSELIAKEPENLALRGQYQSLLGAVGLAGQDKVDATLIK